MKKKIFFLFAAIILILGVCGIFVEIEYVSMVELALDDNIYDAKKDRSSYYFKHTRIKNAINDISNKGSRSGLVDKYIKMYPSYTKDNAQALFANVQIEQEYNESSEVVIKSVAKTRNSAEMVSDFFAKYLIAYFSDEIKSRHDKINAWFDIQINRKRRNGEQIDGLEDKRRKVLMEKHEGDVKLNKKSNSTEIRIKLWNIPVGRGNARKNFRWCLRG